MLGREVPAFLDKSYFRDIAELKKQFGSLRSQGFPAHPAQLCHGARDGKSQLSKTFRCKQAQISGSIGPEAQAGPGRPSRPFPSLLLVSSFKKEVTEVG